MGMVSAALLASLLGTAGCGGGDEGANTQDPLLEEAEGVPGAGTGPGTDPVPPGVPLGVESRGPGAPVSGQSGQDSVSGGPATDSVGAQ